jgi:predicted dehydrogenase
MDRIRLGVIGAGNIAAAFVKESPACRCVEIVAIGSRSEARAQDFAERFSLQKNYGSYQALLDDPEIDAVYIATPNGEHKEWAIKATRSKKHVLCEKPLALTADDAREMFAAARAAGVVLIEAFPFRFQPQTQEVLERVHRGDLGNVVTFSGSFGFAMTNPNNVRLDPAQGGGAIWDVGVYPINLARAVFGIEPSRVCASGKMHAGGVDLTSTVLMEYPDGRSASVWCSFETAAYRNAEIIGTTGSIAYAHSNHTYEETAYFSLTSSSAPATQVNCQHGNGFVLEADAFAKLVLHERGGFVGTTETETIENIATAAAAVESLRTGGWVSV